MREGIYPVQGVVRARSVSLRLGFGEDDFSYAIDFGLPVGGGQSAFALDPEIKRESIWNGPLLRPAAVLCERDNGIVIGYITAHSADQAADAPRGLDRSGR